MDNYTDWHVKVNARFPRRDAMQEERDWKKVLLDLAPGDQVTGEVIAKANFGAWIDIGVGFPALLEIIRINDLVPEKYRANDWCPIGSKITATVGDFVDRQIRLYQI